MKYFMIATALRESFGKGVRRLLPGVPIFCSIGPAGTWACIVFCSLCADVEWIGEIMSTKGADLPDLANPPVVEVAVSAQFDRIPGLTGAHFGLFWASPEIRSSFPHAEEHPPVQSTIEVEGSGFVEPQVQFQVHQTMPSPRYFLLNESKTQLIQLQADRISHNWRKVGGGEDYPRYERIRDGFKRELDLLQDFLGQQKIGMLVPNQCELTYVNHIEVDQSVPGGITIADLIRPWSNEHSKVNGATLESLKLDLKYNMQTDDGAFLGRLHVSVQPAIRNLDKKWIYALILTARGKPIGDGTEGVVSFLDHARQIMGSGFLQLTTDKMQAAWGGDERG